MFPTHPVFLTLPSMVCLGASLLNVDCGRGCLGVRRCHELCCCICMLPWVKQTSILPNLFIGDKKTAKDKDFLLANRITHILNVTPTRTEDPVAGVPNYFEKDARFTYVQPEPERVMLPVGAGSRWRAPRLACVQ